MGEAVISGGSRTGQSETNNTKAGAATASTSSSVVMWERFLPKMVVRVLLVEADDSTRQIIAALLRKCTYRVAAVADGLKAWEVLRGRPCGIDLILTEVDLPLISGYALLTLIMEHDFCKNIPVIMMSSHDSVSTVYKCMLRGASDFLVKPVRKNELRNLWQHVWRKQASSNAAGLGPPDQSNKDEATAENNAGSDNHNSSHCMACVEKGSEAQSSCSKPESRSRGDEDVQHFHGRPQPKRSKHSSDACSGECRSQDKNSRDDTALGDSCKEAIDLIGAFNNHLNVAGRISASNVYSEKFESVPRLDLSLQRSRPSGSVNQVYQEIPLLNHSEASPFSRYINKSLQLASSQLIRHQLKDYDTVLENAASNSEMQNPNTASQKHIFVATVQTDASFSSSENREIPNTVPLRDVRYENGCDSLIPPIYGAPAQKEKCLPLDSPAPGSLPDQTSLGSVADNTHSTNSESLRTENLVSPEKYQSVDANFCNGNEESHLAHDGVLQRSLLREAALTKFRLKPKDRCFEKKVRYESRKKLAEKRPRVKGQFVRQVSCDTTTTHPGNS